MITNATPEMSDGYIYDYKLEYRPGVIKEGDSSAFTSTVTIYGTTGLSNRIKSTLLLFHSFHRLLKYGLFQDYQLYSCYYRW